MRICTDAWERLKSVTQETEVKKYDKSQPIVIAPETQARKRQPRITFITMAALAVVSVLSVSFWSGLPERLVTSVRDVIDLKTRMELLQAKMKTLEDERQRLAIENGRLSMQNEQRAIQSTRLMEKLEHLRPEVKPEQRVKQIATPREAASEEDPGAPRANQQSSSVKQHHAKGGNERL